MCVLFVCLGFWK